MNIRIASDVGGTFTDSIAYDPATRRIGVSKVPTTPQAREVGTVESLRRTLAELGARGEAVDYVGHGMTTATNAVIQRRGAKTAFVTNRGFRDLLLIGRQDRPSLYDIDIVRTPPLVPRELCYGIGGRLDADGREIEPLATADLAEAAADMRARGVEAVAVVFLHAYANPVHERQAKAVLEQHLPGVVVCISTDIVREFREFERASTTVLNAFLTPVMSRYLGALSARLRDGDAGLGVGRDKPIMVMEASGGLMTVEWALARPVHTVLSGPAGGVVAGAHFAGLVGADTIITMDIGGTSTDISLIRNGRPETTRNARIGQTPIRLPVIDINAIGAGGGSIAWIDDGGALRVGPISAEAVPGPACYGHGGTRPTSHRRQSRPRPARRRHPPRRHSEARRRGGAQGRPRPCRRAPRHRLGRRGGRHPARRPCQHRARHSRVSVERGHDPRLCTLVAFGGAGPMHGTPVARELRIGRVAIPPAPGILCALGQLLSDLRHDLIETHIFPYRSEMQARAAAVARRLADAADRLLAADRVPREKRAVEVRVEARYVGQSYELPIAFDHRDAGAWSRVVEDFHTAHRNRFGHADPEAPIEIVGFGATAIGKVDAPELPMLAVGESSPPTDARTGTRRVFFEGRDPGDAGDWATTQVLARDKLLAGNRIAGPAIVEEISATTVLYPGDRAEVHASGVLIVECPS